MPPTRLLRLDPARPDPEALEAAAACLRSGGLVAFPTETVYGLGADARNAEAVQSIFRAKGRPASDPLIVHVPGLAVLPQVAAAVPPLARALAEAFWPGPLTLILPRGSQVTEAVTSGGPTVAVRAPSHPVARALLAASGVPIAAPSANRFARPSPTTARHVLEDLEGRVDIVLDAGPVTIGLESTIVDVTQSPPVILRPGGLPLEALRAFAPDIAVQARFLEADSETAAAPGQFLRHYAPRAVLEVFDGPRVEVLAAMRARADDWSRQGKSVGVLALDEDAGAFAEMAVERLGPEDVLATAGQRLFAALRALDDRSVDVILARLPEPAGLGLAIRDRLYRAAEGRLTLIK